MPNPALAGIDTDQPSPLPKMDCRAIPPSVGILISRDARLGQIARFAAIDPFLRSKVAGILYRQVRLA